MSAYKPWKEFERRHAKRLKGVRLWRPDYGDSLPDGETFKDCWDCKALSRQSIVRLFEECEKKYRQYTANRRFHLALFDPTRKHVGDLVVVHADRYAELVEKESLLDNFLQEFTEFVEPTP